MYTIPANSKKPNRAEHTAKIAYVRWGTRGYSLFREARVFLINSNHFTAMFLLAPKLETVGDFWLMIWNENIRCIAALVLLIEGGRVSDCFIICNTEQ